jgi:hypothetical protein
MSIQSFKTSVLHGVLLAMALGASGACAAAAPSGAGFRITYLVFSGRPNPTVTVTDAAAVQAIQAGLDGALANGTRAKNDAGDPVLGYNGILIESTDKGGSSPQYVVKGRLTRIEPVSDGVVAPASTATESQVSVDLEARLLELGQKRGVLDPSTLGFLLDSMR